jgi:hypothetical protein
MKTFRDQLRTKPLLGSAARRTRTRGGSRSLNSVSSNRQGCKAGNKDIRIGVSHRSPSGATGKSRTKGKNEAGTATINPDLFTKGCDV